MVQIVHVLLLLGAPADGSASAVESTSNASPKRSLSVTIAPLPLLYPVAEVTGEFRLHDWLGGAVVLGAGHGDSFGGKDRTYYEVGVQARAYPTNDFERGLVLGFESLAVMVPAGRSATRRSGLGGGAFVGAKETTKIGFTVEGHIGMSRYYARQTDLTTGNHVNKSETALLINLGIGWSFPL